MRKVRVTNGTQTRIVQPGMIPPGFSIVEDVQPAPKAQKQDDRPLNELPPSYLKDIKNDTLKAFLKEQGIEFREDMVKKELIELVQEA